MRIGVTTEAGSPAEKIQQMAANLIDEINNLQTTAGTQEDIGEFKRLQAAAMTDIEKGAMLGVKAATTR